MPKIELKELIPPIIFRVFFYFKRKFFPVKKDTEIIKISPFDAVPPNLEPKWILDVGANRGDVTIAGLKSFPNANIICFEPVHETFDTLSERLVQYSDRVHLFNCALSNENTDGEINITSFHGANSIEAQADYHKRFNPHVRELKKEKISLVKLDDFLEHLPSKKIDIMKIDVEGHELNVLKGGIEFISNNVDVIIIEISMMRDLAWDQQSIFPIFELLNKCGFSLVNITDLYPAKDENLLLAQMDCIFRKRKNIKKTATNGH